MKQISIGNLRHRIAIQTYTEIPLGTSEVQKSWSTIDNCWANIEALQGLTYFDTQQIGKGITHKITIRYNPQINVTAENWVFYMGKRFRIRFVKNIDERRRYLELLCEVEQLAIDNFEVGDEAVGDPLADVMAQ